MVAWTRVRHLVRMNHGHKAPLPPVPTGTRVFDNCESPSTITEVDAILVEIIEVMCFGKRACLTERSPAHTSVRLRGSACQRDSERPRQSHEACGWMLASSDHL